MKKLLFLTLCILLSSCITNYYSVNLEEDTPVYTSTRNGANAIVVIPRGSSAYIASGSKSYIKIKWNNFNGWAINPRYSSYSSNTNTTRNYSNSSTGGSSSKTVSVKGYTRKDGTYVRPYTRSAPRRR